MKQQIFRLLATFFSLTALVLMLASYGGERIIQPQVTQQNWVGKGENDLNLEVYIFFPQTYQTRLFGTDREFKDPFRPKETDVFTTEVTGIDSQTQTIILGIRVDLPSLGSYPITVSGIANQSALYLMIPDQNGNLKKSSVPFCYFSWNPPFSSSFHGVIDFTVGEDIRWI